MAAGVCGKTKSLNGRNSFWPRTEQPGRQKARVYTEGRLSVWWGQGATRREQILCNCRMALGRAVWATGMAVTGLAFPSHQPREKSFQTAGFGCPHSPNGLIALDLVHQAPRSQVLVCTKMLTLGTLEGPRDTKHEGAGLFKHKVCLAGVPKAFVSPEGGSFHPNVLFAVTSFCAPSDRQCRKKPCFCLQPRASSLGVTSGQSIHSCC